MRLTECSILAIRTEDKPENWYEIEEHLCGVPLPQLYATRTNLSACCKTGSAVKVHNDCFYYCQTDLNNPSFGTCVRDQGLEDVPVFASSCNFHDGGDVRQIVRIPPIVEKMSFFPIWHLAYLVMIVGLVIWLLRWRR